MNFDFSQDDKMLRDQVARFLSDQCSSKPSEACWKADAAYATEVWDGLVSMGLTGTAIPENYGGVGAGYLSLCLVLNSWVHFWRQLRFHRRFIWRQKR